MNNLIVIGLLFLISLILGIIKYKSIYLHYYFVVVRLPALLKGEVLVLSDFVLFIIFILGLFGHLCVMSLNITKGVEAILSRVLERK